MGGGGPIMNALQRRQMGPQVSAPGAGNQADSMGKIKMALDMIRDALSGVPPGSPLYNDVVRAMSRLSRHLPQGQPTAGVESTQLRDLLRAAMKNAFMGPLGRMMGGAGGQGGAPGGGAQPPMPSTPLPGA
jgi:hypothetical protein